jgi:hypothetical protein
MVHFSRGARRRASHLVHDDLSRLSLNFVAGGAFQRFRQ